MDVGIAIPGHTNEVIAGEHILEWAQKADAGPFSSLASIDRLVHSNYEPMIALAAAAGATRRVRLITTILLAPLRNVGVLAKEAASLDAISGGRLTLGLGIGAREDDYLAAPTSFKDRAKRLEAQVAMMRHIWRGEKLGYGIGPVGPSPSQNGGPPILLGAVSPIAIDRVGHLADGFIASPGKHDDVRKLQAAVNRSWKASGRTGKPRFVTLAYYSLGPNSLARGVSNLRQYFAFIGTRAEQITTQILNRPQDVKNTIREHSDLGADELIFLPTIPDMDQVDRLAELVK